MFKRVVLILLLAVLCIGGYAAFRYQNTSVRRLKDKYSEELRPVQSSVDKDGDGIDDQTDILYGALEYIKTKPKYESRYYNGGYPDDGYGVCTDVVAYALRSAGYDLMELVQDDRVENPEAYADEKPDKNIDFRRVRNLNIYFSRNAVSLTTDVRNIEQWHGGDIVVFNNHIGVVSDRRNKNGVPYLIHHTSPFQSAYEQDLMEKRNDIIGHYRISE